MLEVPEPFPEGKVEGLFHTLRSAPDRGHAVTIWQHPHGARYAVV